MKPKYVKLIGFFVSILGGFLAGYNTSIISGAILFIQKSYNLGASADETLISSLLWGALIGAILAGILAHHIEHQRLLLISTLIVLVGNLVDATHLTIFDLDVSRYIIGFGLGVTGIVANVYIADVAPKEVRGKLLALLIWAWTVGDATASGTNLILAESRDWRLMLALGAVPAFIRIIGLLWIPQNPIWLERKGNMAKAQKEAEKFLRPQMVAPFFADNKITDIPAKDSWRTLFSSKQGWILLIAIVLASIEAATAIDALVFYAPMIFEAAGVSSAKMAIGANLVTTLFGVAMSLIAVSLVDKLGRKRLLQTGLLLIITFLTLLGLSFLLLPMGVARAWIVLIVIALFSASFDLTVGTAVWVLLPEVFPSVYRTFGLSAAVVVNKLTYVLLAQFFLSLTSLLSFGGTFLLFAGTSFGAYLFIRRYITDASTAN